MTNKELVEKLKQINSMSELQLFILSLEGRPTEVKRRIGSTMGRKVYCFETDTIYDSIGHAADALGIKFHQNISTAATKGGSTHGYHFKYVV